MDVNDLKLNVIEAVESWAQQAFLGKYSDRSNILNMIALVEVWDDIPNVGAYYELLVYG